MAKKHWIFVKRGLSEDPKHRAQMGECIWLYLHILDRADFETGIAYDWKDAQEAAEMSMSLPTLRHQRRKLEELGYITAKKGMHKQDLIIHNWHNPRDYSGGVRNVVKQSDDESDNPLSPESDNQSYNQSDNQSDNHPSSHVNTPTSDSESESSSPSDNRDKKPLIDPIDHALSFKSASAKAELALQIESAVKVKLGMEATSTKNGMKFVEIAVKKHLAGEDYNKFVDWYLVNVDKKYRSFNGMIEKWPMAFDAPAIARPDPENFDPMESY